MIVAEPKIVSREFDHELWQHRNHDAERQHVERNGDQNEKEGRIARLVRHGKHISEEL